MGCGMRQYGKKQGLRGQITVFISMILMILFAFLCVLMESARTAGARWYLQMAVSSSMDSVFSQYHRELWDRYRLLFAEYETPEEIEQDFCCLIWKQKTGIPWRWSRPLQKRLCGQRTDMEHTWRKKSWTI